MIALSDLKKSSEQHKKLWPYIPKYCMYEKCMRDEEENLKIFKSFVENSNIFIFKDVY